MPNKWEWEVIDPSRSGSSGDLAKLFKNEDTSLPGVLAEGAPPPDSTILARESIQNSWDAGRLLQSEMGNDAPGFRLRFVYETFTGAEKDQFVEASGLGELALRVDEFGADDDHRRALGLADSDCLDDLMSDRPLRVLRLEEYGTTGMDGPWTGTASKLYLALVSVGFTVKEKGAGGTYGYGKAGLIRASRIHTVLAHTCFREREDDPGVTRRLLGMTYWGLHGDQGGSYSGFARLGRSADLGGTDPLENAEADELAMRLGFPRRDPLDLAGLGSSFLMVDPVVEPEDLKRAVERNWWPALEDGLIDVEIENGALLIPRPKKDPVLRSFVRAYELATTRQDNQASEEARKDLGSYTPRGSEKRELGHLGLVADLGGWSYASSIGVDSEASLAEHCSLVALIRGPRMVVDYLRVSSAQPHIRGAFVADESIDDLLRQTEPKSHNMWLDKVEEEGVATDAPKVAREVLKRIRSKANEFRVALKPPPVREQDLRLPFFENLFRDILEDRGSNMAGPPPPDPRPVSITMAQEVEPTSNDEIRLRAVIGFALTDQCGEAEARCRLRIECNFDEDGRKGSPCSLDFTSIPTGFEVADGDTLIGVLDHAVEEVRVLSAPYAADWSVQLVVVADLVEIGDGALT